MTADEPRESFEIEPTPIGPRRRRVDPLAIGVAVVVIGLGLAIVKPWESMSSGVASIAPASTDPLAAASARPTIPEARPGELPPAARVLGALRPHDAWGVRAIVSNPDGETERWVQAPIEGDTYGVFRVGAGAERIAALGVTTPSQRSPLDVRIWRPTADGDWQWLDARPVASDLSGGDLLFWPPVTGGREPGTWPAGRYRIDLLMGATIERIDIALPGRFERVPGPRQADPPPGELVTSTRVDLADVPTGVFALVDGVAVGLPSTPGTPVDGAAVWLHAPRSDGTATAWLPRATAIGVALPVRAVRSDASIRRMSPDSNVYGSVESGVAYGPDGATPYVLFRARAGDVWRAGAYAIDATWFEAADQYAGTWNVELVPGPDRPESRLLAAARDFVPFVDSTQVVEAPSLFIRPTRVLLIRPEGLTTRSNVGDIGCGGPFRIGRPEVIGIAGALPDKIGMVSLRVVVSSGRSAEQSIRVVPDVVDGLMMIAPSAGGTFADGVYRLTIDGADESERQQLNVCIGDGPFGV